MKLNIPFLDYRKFAVIFSAIILIGSITSLAVNKLNVGLDFSGGTLFQVHYNEPVQLNNVVSVVEGAGINRSVVQYFGSSSEVTIRIPADADIESDKLSSTIESALKAQRSDAEIRRQSTISPVVGEELREDGALAMLVALMCIMVYVAIRFEWKFAVGSVAALIHDVIIVLGFFSITQIEFDLTVLAALLAVIGYSLNDTIVVYDRIRENFLKMRKGSPIEVMNRSLNQTFNRTIITSLTTLLVLFALFVLGGELINAFSIALIVGVLIGTYSSIYVASTAALALGVTKEDLMPPEIEKEGADQEALY